MCVTSKYRNGALVVKMLLVRHIVNESAKDYAYTKTLDDTKMKVFDYVWNNCRSVIRRKMWHDVVLVISRDIDIDF